MAVAQFTQKAILDTFTGMLRRMPFEKITVSAIVAGCGISPNTFYYHYRDIYDLLEHWLQLVKKRYILEPLQTSDWKKVLRALLGMMKQNSALVYHLFNSTSREWIERYCFEASGDTFYALIRDAVGTEALPEEEMRYLAQYTGCAFLGLVLRYLWRNMEIDIDRSMEKFSAIFENNLRWAIENAQRGAGQDDGM